ncbi:hypothetical protein [Streptomyces mirabilis]|uniref:MmyB family transcriptional regulator n=1 Tax=Streptomyces mirabilis TaxID=68239 RepID=UPI0033197626
MAAEGVGELDGGRADTARRAADQDLFSGREAHGVHPRAVELVGELAVLSGEFAGLWARHDVAETTRGRMRVRHPLVGELNLDRDAYPMPDATGPVLIAFTAEEGGPDAERLQLLAGLLVAPGPAAASRPRP